MCLLCKGVGKKISPGTFNNHFPSQAEKIDIEEKYANLKEEAAGKTKKLKKVWTMLMNAKSEVSVTFHSIANYFNFF